MIKFDPILGLSRTKDDFEGFSQDDIIRMSRKVLTPFHVSTYLPTDSSIYNLTAGVDTKISLPVIPVGGNGFDIYSLGGSATALRFIGSGLGNTDDVTSFLFFTQATILSTSGSGTVEFFGKRRHYTETNPANATDITGFSVKTYITNNQSEAVPVIAPYITDIINGELYEIYVNAAANMSIKFSSFAFTSIERF